MKPSSVSSKAPGKVIKTLKGYYTYIPNPLPPKIIWSNDLVFLLADVGSSLVRLEEAGKFIPVPQGVIQPIVRKEAVFSSQIEGTQTSFQNLYRYEAGQTTFLEQVTDIQEVKRYGEALNYGVERIKTLPISMRLMKEMHAILFTGGEGSHSTPGEFRQTQNWIGRPGATLMNARYIPPPVNEMQHSLADLEKYIHTDSDLPEIIRVALIHYQFEAIHPFLDGNGRIGRLMIPLLLINWGVLSQPLLNLSVFIEKNRTEYYDRLLAVSQKGQWQEWLLFFLQGVKEQANDMILKLNAIQSYRVAVQRIISVDRLKKKLTKVVDYFISTPISSVTQAVEKTKLGNFSTMQRYFDRLGAYGVLREISGGQRNRIYQADEILKILEN